LNFFDHSKIRERVSRKPHPSARGQPAQMSVNGETSSITGFDASDHQVSYITEEAIRNSDTFYSQPLYLLPLRLKARLNDRQSEGG
jgi:hypothetical protein